MTDFAHVATDFFDDYEPASGHMFYLQFNRKSGACYERNETHVAMKNTVQNFPHVSKGKAKESIGKRTKSEDLHADDKAEQRVGNLKQAGERVRDAFRKR